ncbi:efflux RND transporter periplasmic adaptor subunit [Holophaga foetida]|uniref:efflux RND transporter periplasmic adaptor subunit n=1 Tax=Holophaga foetida TaxID=35839 RepID=UPI00024742CA|nr:efflux RND transporter periplasmic adaptor subunit [Holophaga foetida]
MNQQATPDRTYSRFRITGVALLLVAACGIGVLWAAKRHTLNQEAQGLRAGEAAGPRVRVTSATQEGGDGLLNLQGEAQPYASTTLYAKVSGFLRQIHVDKGSPVRQGQVLALLESAETDRDASALKADYENKRRSAERMKELARQGIISSQALEDAESTAQVAREKLASQAAVQGYQRIIAPFSGVVTQRFADPGAMLQNGGSTSTAQPVLSVAQVDRLRVVLFLDQQVAARVKVGTPVEVRSSDRPDQIRQISISRLAGALDTKTKTLLAEADLDNRDGAFLAGGAVLVSLKLPAHVGAPQIPSEAVTIRENKPQVVVVGPDQRVSFHPVILSDDTGTRVQVLQGLKPGEKVILSPAVTLKDGDRVQPVEAPAAAPTGK